MLRDKDAKFYTSRWDYTNGLLTYKTMFLLTRHNCTALWRVSKVTVLKVVAFVWLWTERGHGKTKNSLKLVK